jgi:hypothetical protein
MAGHIDASATRFGAISSCTPAAARKACPADPLPFTSRNLTELIVTQPGSATPGVPRSTSVYGLPQAAMNVTLDGINIQDNSNKSSDGFFNAIFPRADMVEEMTVSSASAGADSNSEGAYQVKMVTRSGSNDWHGWGCLTIWPYCRRTISSTGS